MANEDYEDEATNIAEYEADTERVEGATEPGGGWFANESADDMFGNGDESEQDEPEPRTATEEVEFEYIGRLEEVNTRYGTFLPGRTYSLPANKVRTILRMKQPDGSKAFAEV